MRNEIMKTQNLWKLVVETQLEIDQIEQAVAEVPDITKPTSPIRGVELQRIDVLDGRSFLFVTSSNESARALERCLKVRASGAKVRCAETTAKELYANEPPEG